MATGDYAIGVRTQNSRNIEATCIAQATQIPEIKYFVPAWDAGVMIYDGPDFVGVTTPDEDENTISGRIDPTFKGDIKTGHVTRMLASGPEPTKVRIKIEKLISEYNIGGQANKFYILDENEEIHVIIHCQPHGFAAGLKWEIIQHIIFQALDPITSITEDPDPFNIKTASEILLPEVIFGSATEKADGKAGYTIDQIGSVDLSGKRVMFLQGVGALTGDISKAGDDIHLEMEQSDTVLDLASYTLTFSGNNITGYLNVSNAGTNKLVFSGNKLDLVIKSDAQDCLSLTGADYHVVHNGKSVDSATAATIAAIQSWIDGQGVEDANAIIDNLKDLMDAFGNIPEGDNIIEAIQLLGSQHTSDLSTHDEFLKFLNPHSVVEMAYPFIDGIDGDKDAFAALTFTNGIPRDSDGKIRFWTTIRGRKPIVAPVGGYAGMDRFDTDSLQLLDDEFGPNGEPVYAVDGRENVRAIGEWNSENSAHGNYLNHLAVSSNYAAIEVVGYFDKINTKHNYTTSTYTDDADCYINGVDLAFDQSVATTVTTPLSSRFLDASIVIPIGGNSISLGLNTFSMESTSTGVGGALAHLSGIELAIDSDKVTIPAQKAIAAGKKYDIAYDQSLPHKPDVWAANYGKVGYDGQYDQGLAAWGIGEDVNTSVSDHDADNTQYSGDPLNVFDWVLDSTDVKAYQVLNPFKVSGIHQAENGGTQVNWGTGLDYVALPATGNPVTAGVLYYYASGTKLYKCIKSGTLTYANQTEIETSGLFASRIPVNGYRTAFITHGLINTGLGRNFVRATRWLPPAARHIGDSAIDERNSGQQRPVFEAGDVDFDGQELVNVLNWRQFGNGDANGATAMGFDTLTSSSDRAFVLDDGLTALVGSSVVVNGDGIIPELADDYIVQTILGTGLKLTGDAQNPLGNIFSSLPFGTCTIKLFRNADGTTEITINNVNVGDHIATSYGSFLDMYLYQPKLPDLPVGSHIINEYMGMADAVSPTEAGNLVIGKGVRRVHATRDVFYDQSASSGTDWTLGNLNPECIGGFVLYSGNGNRDISYSLPFSGKGISVIVYLDTDRINPTVKIDGQLLTSANFPNAVVVPSHGTFSLSTGVWTHGASTVVSNASISIFGLDDEQHIIEVSGTTATTPTFSDVIALDLHPGIHRSNHYQKLTYNPYVSPESVGGGDGINGDNLIVSPDRETLEELRRPDAEDLPEAWFCIGKDDGSISTDTDIFHNVLRGTAGEIQAGSRNFLQLPSIAEMEVMKTGFYLAGFNYYTSPSTQLLPATVNLHKNGQSVNGDSQIKPATGAGMSIWLGGEFLLYLQKGDRINIYTYGGSGLDLTGASITFNKFYGHLLTRTGLLSWLSQKA
jgi:hypothetical protein